MIPMWAAGDAGAHPERIVHDIHVLLTDKSGNPIEGASIEFIESARKDAEKGARREALGEAEKPKRMKPPRVTDGDGKVVVKCVGAMRSASEDEPPNVLQVSGHFEVVVPGFVRKTVPIDKSYPLEGQAKRGAPLRLTLKLGWLQLEVAGRNAGGQRSRGLVIAGSL